MKTIIDEDVKICLKDKEEIERFLRLYPKNNTEISIKLNLEEVQSYLYNNGIINRAFGIFLINLPFNIRIKIMQEYIEYYLKFIDTKSNLYEELKNKYSLLDEIKTKFNDIKCNYIDSSDLKDSIEKEEIKLLRKEYLKK